MKMVLKPPVHNIAADFADFMCTCELLQLNCIYYTLWFYEALYIQKSLNLNSMYKWTNFLLITKL